MLARDEWRVRHVDYDNAPYGRATHLPAPYRWWLATVAWLDHLIGGRPMPLAVEHAALWADPLVHGLLLVVATGFVAWRFGMLSAAVLASSLVGLFPFAAGFLPGAPDSAGLVRACALGSMLLLLASVMSPPMNNAERPGRAGFVVAGVLGGLGLWMDPSGTAIVLVGVLLGGLLVAAAAAPANENSPAWRAWALGGAAICGLAGLVEFSPDDAAWQRLFIYPLLGLGWIGAGELLARAVTWRRRSVIALAAVLDAGAAVLAVKSESWGPMLADPLAQRLTGLSDSAMAPNTGAWISRDGFNGQVWATLLPVLLLPLGGALLRARRREAIVARSFMLALGPALVALVFAGAQLQWWNTFGAALLPVLVVATGLLATQADGTARRWIWIGAVAVTLLPGAMQLSPNRQGAADRPLTESEATALMERDLAHWLASRTGYRRAVVFAAPDVTASLCYHGGLRGLWALSWENQGGLTAATRIASATNREEAFALLQQREVSFIVVPSWDSFLDQYAMLGRGTPGAAESLEKSFAGSLHGWDLPPWLRPAPYYLPPTAGFENQSVTVFEVVDEQGPAEQAGRLAEYFIDTGRMEQASDYRANLRRFPTDAGALAALALVEAARGDADGFSKALATLSAGLERRSDRNLSWDRRISVAAVLAQGKQLDRAREQMKRCVADVDAARLRSLSPSALIRFHAMARLFQLEIVDPQLRQLIIDLVPPKLRSRL
jgi:hypothetical protein